MRRLFLLICLMTFFSEPCFAENYYTENEHRLSEYKDEEGNILAMDTITKVSDEGTCNEVAKIKGKSFGKWVASSSWCVKGTDIISGVSSTDETLNYMFENQPRDRGIYVSFTDLNGFQTRFYFQILAGPKSPVPGFHGDLSNEATVPLANVFIKSLEKSGIKNAKIIYPTKGD